MIHTIGFETSGSLAALTALTPIPDQTLRISGSQFFTLKGVTNIVYAMAMINSAAATLRAQIASPSLRAILNYDIAPIANGLVFGSLPARSDLRDTPLQLLENEPFEVDVQNGAAVMNRAFLWMADGAVKPTLGKIYTVRATLAASLVTASWVNSAVTLAQTLPAGHYQCVGIRAWSANGNVVRAFPVGSAFRPGVPMGNAEANVEWEDFRWGNSGVLFEFDNTVPPTFDVMGITDTAEVLYLDLIKTA